MQKILLGSFYDKNITKNPFEIKFPHLWYVKNLGFFSLNMGYNIMDDLNKWEDLDEMEDICALKINNLISQGDENYLCYEDDYGNEYKEREGERELVDEMEALSYIRNRRYKIFRDKIFYLRNKIYDLINIKSFKIRLKH